MRWWRGTVSISLAVGVVVLTFVATTTFVLWRSRSIGEAARGITQNAVPSIELLLAARTTVHVIAVRLEQQVASGLVSPAALAPVRRGVDDLKRRIADYLSLPKYPGERESWVQLAVGLDGLGRSVDRVLTSLEAGQDAEARRVFQTSFEVAADRLERLLADSERINAEQVTYFAARMEALRAAARRQAIILNGLCVMLAALLLFWLVRNTHRQQELQESLIRHTRERAEEMELFAGRVAHDIQTPLGTSLLSFELLSSSADQETRQAAARGMRSIGRVRSIVDGLLDFARAGAKPAEEFVDVAEVALDVVDGLRESAGAAGVCLEVGPAAPGLRARASRGVLFSVLTNLVQNAIKFMGEAVERRVSLEVKERDGRARVEVRDSGPGLPPDLEQRVFEPYFRARNPSVGGLGLGLATVKRLVEAHGGRVGVRSRPGEGAVFWFELPLDPGPRLRSG